MADSVIKSNNVKRMTISGTTNAYGSLVFPAELESIYNRICGIVRVNKSEIHFNILQSGNVHLFACWDARTTNAAANVDVVIEVAYI